MSAQLPDEYQDGVSAGSLAKARRCWLDLAAAEALQLPHRFHFRFDCPSEHTAARLIDFLRHTDDAGFVDTGPGSRVAPLDAWMVTGTVNSAVWSLPDLEHLFMRLRAAASRYGSSLVTLECRRAS